MKRGARLCTILGMILIAALGIQAQTPEKHAITFDDLMKMHRISAPQISRDGKWVAYSISTPDMEANRSASNIWIIPATGGEAIQLTQSGKDSAPAWAPDGKELAFLSS